MSCIGINCSVNFQGWGRWGWGANHLFLERCVLFLWFDFTPEVFARVFLLKNISWTNNANLVIALFKFEESNFRYA